jgi:hypothetical protein
MCVIVKNMLFISTNRLHFRERISLMKKHVFNYYNEKALFSKDMANYALFTFVPNIYNPTLIIKAVMCMKCYTNYWAPLRMLKWFFFFITKSFIIVNQPSLKKALITKFVWYPCRPYVIFKGYGEICSFYTCTKYI